MDYTLFRWLNALANHGHVWNQLIKAWASYAVLAFPAVLVLAWLFPGSEPHRLRAAAVIGAVAAIVAVGIDQPINHAVDRPRPYASHPGRVRLLLGVKHDNSFPSDHTAFAFAVAASFWPVRRRLSVGLAVLGLTVGLARVIAGEHYPGDILGGALIGIATAALVWLVGRRPLGWLTRIGERVYEWLLRPFRRLVARRA